MAFACVCHFFPLDQDEMGSAHRDALHVHSFFVRVRENPEREHIIVATSKGGAGEYGGLNSECGKGPELIWANYLRNDLKCGQKRFSSACAKNRSKNRPHAVCWTAHQQSHPTPISHHDERLALLGLHVSDSRLARCGGGEGGEGEKRERHACKISGPRAMPC